MKGRPVRKFSGTNSDFSPSGQNVDRVRNLCSVGIPSNNGYFVCLARGESGQKVISPKNYLLTRSKRRKKRIRTRGCSDS